MTREINNELKKIHCQISSLLICAFIVLLNIIIIFTSRNNNYDYYNWKDKINKDISDCYSLLETDDMENDEIMETVIKEQIDVLQYRLDHNIPDIPSLSELYLNAFSLTTYSMIFFMLLKASSTICSEYTSKTIYPLFTRNIRRSSILLAKLISLLVYLFELIGLSITSFYIIGHILLGKYPFDSFFLQNNNEGEIITVPYKSIVMESVFFGTIILLSYCAFILFVAVYVKKSITTILIGFLTYAFGSDIINFLPLHFRIKNLLFPVAFDNLFLSIGSYDVFPRTIIEISLVSLIIHFLLFTAWSAKKFSF